MVEIDWVEIPAGEFIFGLSAAQTEDLLAKLTEQRKGEQELAFYREELHREMPELVIGLETFYISRFPITWNQYIEFAQSDHRFSERNVFSDKSWGHLHKRLREQAATQEDHPAVTNWHFAMAFCDWIGARLPSSAEWEKAARSTDGRLYPWGNIWDATRGNFAVDRKRWPHKTSPVTAYPLGQSPYGVMDIVGNTYEWTLSTAFGPSGGEFPTELVVCRSCECDFSSTAEQYNPIWFRNRVTHILRNEMHFGGVQLVGFRPVLDEWQKQAWAGVW